MFWLFNWVETCPMINQQPPCPCNIKSGIAYSNTKYKTNYKPIALGSLRGILCRLIYRSTPWPKHTAVNNYLWNTDPKLISYAMYRIIWKVADQSRQHNSRQYCLVFTETSSERPTLYQSEWITVNNAISRLYCLVLWNSWVSLL